MTDTVTTSAEAGSLAELQRERPAAHQGRRRCRSWCSGTRAGRYAIEDRCPHLGFPLHQGTVEAGLVTCHWHHARFDLVSGCTLDPWADDAQRLRRRDRGDDVFVDAARRRAIRSGTCSSACATASRTASRSSSRSRCSGCSKPASARPRSCAPASTSAHATAPTGWGAGLTVLVAMANLLPHLDADRPRARARARRSPSSAATPRGHAPRFADRAARAPTTLADRPARATGTGASSRPARRTPPSARSRPRSPTRRDARRGRGA